MNETERKQIKSQLLKCAKENENKVTFTGYVIVSSVCRAAVERIVELEAQIKTDAIHIRELQKRNGELTDNVKQLEQQIEKMKCCGNCKHYQFQNDAGYYTCTKDGKRNGKNYRSCEFNLEKWEGR